MTRRNSSSKIGVYADVSNMYHNGGQRLQYDALREFACRDFAEPMRLNAYVVFDTERAKRDPVYREGATNFHSKLRDYGYKVIVKEIAFWHDERGNRYGKADVGLHLAIDVLQQADNLDRVLIASGDSEFIPLVRALQNRGCRVEVVALDNASYQLRQEADLFYSGYLIPNMVPIDMRAPRKMDWGEIGSRVRGTCYWFEQERGFGYMRFLKRIDAGLWLTDARHEDSPYDTAFFRSAHLPPEARQASLPSRNVVFELELAASEKGEGLQAMDITVAGSAPRAAPRFDDEPEPATERGGGYSSWDDEDVEDEAYETAAHDED